MPELPTVIKLIQDGDVYVRLRRFNPSFPNECFEILAENRIHFGSVRSQDDIFEGDPVFIWRREPTTYSEMRELVFRRRPLLGQNQQKKMAHEMFARSSDPTIRDQMQFDFECRLKEIFHASSILSFFRDPYLKRHWDEYADRGSGYGLLFDFSSPWSLEAAPGLHLSSGVPFEVRYIQEGMRPTIELAMAPMEPDRAFDQLEAALLTKSGEWVRQGEERLLRVGVPAGHVNFPQGSLRGLVLGWEISPDHRKEIIELARRHHQDIEIFQLKLTEEGELSFELVEESA